MAELRCAVVMLPGENGDADRLAASLEEAGARELGPFGEVRGVQPYRDDDQAALLLREASLQAAADGFDWLLAVSDAETVVPDIFGKVAPALRIHDAVWGGAGVQLGNTISPLERVTRLAAQDYATYFHLALQWWIGPTHFIRPGIAAAVLAGAAGNLADYRLRIWKEHRALKTAHALTVFHGALPHLSLGEREALLGRLDAEPVFSTVRHGGRVLRLPYTGRNPIIERDHTRGQFFEHAELDWLADTMPRGLRIVDAGANTGNHTAFFAAVMEAESVVPLEPDRRACAAIRAAVAANGLHTVRDDLLGIAVGAEAARMHAVFSAGGGLGATRLVRAADGEIEVRRLDDLPLGRVDLLKIDVEGMEMAVLAGAEALVQRDSPTLFIEVLDESVAEFLAWVDSHAYRIERLFPDKTHSNYLVVPAGPRR